MDNAKMINALTAAVLANASDDAIRDEVLLRKTVLPVRVTDMLAFLDDCNVAETFAEVVKRLPTDLLLEEVTTRGHELNKKMSDVALWERIEDKDGIGAKWANENPSEALENIDEGDLEFHCREWVSENMSEVMEWIDMDLVVDELTRDQKSQLLVSLANEARF